MLKRWQLLSIFIAEVRDTGNDVVTELNKDTSGRKGETNKPSLPFIESIPKSKSSNDSRTTPSMTQNPRHLVAEPGSKMDSTMKGSLTHVVSVNDKT